MKASETILRKLIEGGKQFVVPMYQRQYSWTTDDDLPRMWKNIVEQYDWLTSHPDADAAAFPDQFIGAIVLAREPEGLFAEIARVNLVDGQQRVITIMLLLCALRDSLDEGDERRKSFHSYLFNENQTGPDKYKLIPKDDDKQSTLAYFDGLTSVVGEGRIRSAYEFFKTQIAAGSAAAGAFDPDQLRATVLSRLSLVEISTGAGDNVHRIFESLNDTGQKLTQADLIRNYFFMLLEDRAEEIYKSEWVPMQARLGEHVSQLFWANLVASSPMLNRSGVYRELQSELAPHEIDRDYIAETLHEYNNKSVDYAWLLDPSLCPTKAIQPPLQQLATWGHQVCMPTLMYLANALKENRLSPAEVGSAVSLVLSYMVRRMIAGIPTNNLNRIFARTPSQVDEFGGPAVQHLHRALSISSNRWPSDNELRRAVLSESFYLNGTGAQRFFVLKSIDLHLEPGKEKPDFSGMTIEHIMPQTLDQWRPDLVAWGEDPDALFRDRLHTLPNLTLTGYNPEMNNRRFGDKKGWLADSKLAMNTDIAKETRWTHEELDARASKLIDAIRELWPGPVVEEAGAAVVEEPDADQDDVP